MVYIMKVVLHTCNNCGQEKEIYVKPEENIDNIKGCVCNRTVEKPKDLKILK
jgi:DNA replicative helicase MCM subunit Mcm2 (Cdc46/Mcm family)